MPKKDRDESQERIETERQELVVGELVDLSEVAKKSAGPLHHALFDFLQGEEWKYTVISDDTVRFGLHGDNGPIDGHAVLHEEDETFLFYSRFPINVPEANRQAVADLVNRINYRLRIGNFEMDMDDGAMFFRTSIDVEGDVLSPTLIHNMVYPNFGMMDRYIPKVMKVIYGNLSPSEALDSDE